MNQQSRYLVKHRRRFSQLASLGITLLGILLFTLTACNPIKRQGITTKEDVVNIYLRALKAKDNDLILSLIPESHVADQAVQAKVMQLGGRDIQEVRIDYFSPTKPQLVVAKIRGWYVGNNGEKVEFKDEINLRQDEERWYIILGRARNGIVDTPTQIK